MMNNKGLQKEFMAICPGRVWADQPLAEHTTFGIGGPARFLIEVLTEDELQNCFKLARKNRVPVIVLGRGSNVLISDKGIKGCVIRLGGYFTKFGLLRDKKKICVGAAAKLHALVVLGAKKHFSKIEYLSGIPGTVGGAVCMNSGIREHSIGDFVVSARVFKPAQNRFFTIPVSKLRFGYRMSRFQKSADVVCSVILKFPIAKDAKSIVQTIEGFMKRRTATQPLNMRSAGSVFKNPRGDSAGRLIESCGLRGIKIGNAAVSDKHANFIVNLGSAKARDVACLMKRVQSAVKKQRKVLLQPEICFMGEFNETARPEA
ncbi:UDP-N-acetylmuramate dehydrogenase [Elusimicrobiota bacterium]